MTNTPRQTQLPFDKQQFRAVMAGIESFPLESLSKANARKVRAFLVMVFKGEYYDATLGRMRHVSAPDGTVTCRQYELAEIMGVSLATMERWIKYAVSAGAIERATDADEHGRRRTTITFRLAAILAASPHCEGMQTLTNPDHPLTNPDHSLTVRGANPHGEGLPSIGTRARSTTYKKVQQQQQRPSLNWAEVEKRLVARGVQYPRKCIAAAKVVGQTPENVDETLRQHPAASAQSLGRHFIYGSPLTRQRPTATPWRTKAAELEETIIFRGRRSGKSEDEIAHELRQTLATLEGSEHAKTP